MLGWLIVGVVGEKEKPDQGRFNSHVLREGGFDKMIKGLYLKVWENNRHLVVLIIVVIFYQNK